MKAKCSNKDCTAPIHCHENNDNYLVCDLWLKNNAEKTVSHEKKNKGYSTSELTWSGESFSVEDVNQISRRNIPVYIGVIGKADAGKTTFLAMLYTLLLRGEIFKDYSFAGSNTIIGWDELYHKLKVQQNKVAFPEPTPSQYNRLLHLALRNNNSLLKDIFISDTSGEVFSLWSKNRDDNNAENARWVYENSNGFILFIDCVDLISRKNAAKTEIIDIAQMLKHDLKDKPVVTVWSKSDRKEEINSVIVDSLTKELEEFFPNYYSIDISNFSVDDPDRKVHVNNIAVIDWLLNNIIIPVGKSLSVSSNYNQDLFLNYKGK